MGRKYQNILETVGNTPVVKINRLAPPGINLYVKIEAFNPLGSVKDRLALGVIEAAEKAGELKPGQTVIEASSGTTGLERSPGRLLCFAPATLSWWPGRNRGRIEEGRCACARSATPWR